MHNETFKLENGADMNITDSDGETPLRMAESIGNNAAVQFLKDWTK